MEPKGTEKEQKVTKRNQKKPKGMQRNLCQGTFTGVNGRMR